MDDPIVLQQLYEIGTQLSHFADKKQAPRGKATCTQNKYVAQLGFETGASDCTALFLSTMAHHLFAQRILIRILQEKSWLEKTKKLL